MTKIVKKIENKVNERVAVAKAKSFRECLKEAGMPEPKSLTRKQVAEFRKSGLDPVMGEQTQENRMEMVDWILLNVYPELNDDAPYNLCFELALTTYKLTYSREDETKNY